MLVMSVTACLFPVSAFGQLGRSGSDGPGVDDYRLLPAETPGVAPVEAEIQFSQMVFEPTGSIRARFLIHNRTSEPITLRLAPHVDAEDGISLPRSLVLGTPEQPAVDVIDELGNPLNRRWPDEGSTSNGEAGNDATAAERSASADAAGESIVLAGFGSLGLEVDLATIFRAARYARSYRVTWRPAIAGVMPTSATFRVEPRYDVLMVTDFGTMTFVMNYDRAPLNVANFLELARSGFYNGKAFHRLVPGLAVQGGCPLGSGRGIRPDGKLVTGELSDAPFVAGTLAMATRNGDPDSGSCQFFVCATRVSAFDGTYTIVGQARDPESLRTLEQLMAVDTTREGRPREPLLIRSMTLHEAGRPRTRLELRGSGAPAPERSPAGL